MANTNSKSHLDQGVSIALLECCGILLHLAIEIVSRFHLALDSLAGLQQAGYYGVLLPGDIPFGIDHVHAAHDLREDTLS